MHLDPNRTQRPAKMRKAERRNSVAGEREKKRRVRTRARATREGRKRRSGWCAGGRRKEGEGGPRAGSAWGQEGERRVRWWGREDSGGGGSAPRNGRAGKPQTRERHPTEAFLPCNRLRERKRSRKLRWALKKTLRMEASTERKVRGMSRPWSWKKTRRREWGRTQGSRCRWSRPHRK